MATCDRCGKKVAEARIVEIPGYRICPACDAATEQKILGSFAAVTMISSDPSVVEPQGTGDKQAPANRRGNAIGIACGVFSFIALIAIVWGPILGHLSLWWKIPLSLLAAIGSMIIAAAMAAFVEVFGVRGILCGTVSFTVLMTTIWGPILGHLSFWWKLPFSLVGGLISLAVAGITAPDDKDSSDATEADAHVSQDENEAAQREAMQLQREQSGIPFTCPQCRKKLKARSYMAGETVPCKHCGETVTVPE